MTFIQLVISLLLFSLSYCSLRLISEQIDVYIDVESDTDSIKPNPSFTPIVLYHGMGDTAKGSIYGIQQFIENELTGVYVTSIQMGDNFEEDLMSSYFMNLNDQVDIACQILRNDTNLKNGYNGIGFSQGGQIMRAIAQRCPTPPMINLISFGGQHQGVYGLPRCPGENKTLCDLVRKLMNYGAYVQFVQNHLVQAEYWHDPIQESLYKQKSVFLADINNENIPRNEDYKTRISNLKNMVLVKYLNDSIVDPRDTEIFGFYKPGQSKEVYSLRESDLYQQDWIGLKALDQNGSLHIYEVLGDHLQFNMKWFRDEIIDKYLR